MTSTNASQVIFDPVYGSRSEPENHLAKTKPIESVQNNLLIVMRSHIPDGKVRAYDALTSELSDILGEDVSTPMLSKFETDTHSERIVPGFAGASGLSDGLYSVSFYMEIDGEKYISIRRAESTNNGETQFNNALVRNALNGLLKLHSDVAKGVRDPRYFDRPHENAICGNVHIGANSFPSDIHVDDRVS